MSILTVDENGVALKLGRARRLATEPQRRVLTAKRGYCWCQGCTWEARYCVPHHMDEWWKGGGTDVERMVLLCHHHHSLVSEGGYRLELQPDGTVLPIAPREQATSA
jgi:hypothetical protein